MKNTAPIALALTLLCSSGLACSDESESDRAGIASTCVKDADCPEFGGFQLVCLSGFKGGYCGLEGCTRDAECPEGAACIAEGGTNYCFRVCVDKPECNRHRTAEVEANCVGSVVHVEASNSAKVCVPPSGG